ncbi:YCF48-related protein [Mangrovivirga sp. M17]|uniref:YCF48-related protein n=1 Tax=Mangrovivirga halotolerans TaxID=2993936 RepID=A0ABT3RSE4_9BACT|nr:YCF48-related protein [Mangrovivirga halotolerans]MCX2744172.1 YCF48-related protein [Mangrovivirga halotolerans]
MNRAKLLLIGFYTLIFSFSINAQWKEIGRINDEFAITELKFINDQLGFAASHEGVYKTIDGGINWDLIPYFPERTSPWYTDTSYYSTTNRFKFEFLNDSIGFIYGRLGKYDAEVIFKTNDAGKTLERVHYKRAENQPSYIITNINDLEILSKDSIIAVGEDGIILTSLDGGETWDRKLHILRKDLNSIEFYNDKIGYIGGDKCLLKTEDGGHSWVKNYFPGEATDISLINKDEMIILGEYEFYSSYGIYKASLSGNGGINSSFIKPFGFFDEIFFINSSLIYIDGSAGILKLEKDLSYSISNYDVETSGKIRGRSSVISENTAFKVFGDFKLFKNENLSFEQPEHPVVIDSLSKDTVYYQNAIFAYGKNFSSITNIDVGGKLPLYEIYDDGLLEIRIPYDVDSNFINFHWGDSTTSYPLYVKDFVKLEYSYFDSELFYDHNYSFKGQNLDSIHHVEITQINTNEFKDYEIIGDSIFNFSIPRNDYSYYAKLTFYDVNNVQVTTLTLRMSSLPVISRVQGFFYDPYHLNYNTLEKDYFQDYHASYGSYVEIKGEHFKNIKKVLIGDQNVSYSLQSENEILLTIPENTKSGLVKIITKSGIVINSKEKLIINPPPNIDYIFNLNPISGDTIIAFGERLIETGYRAKALIGSTNPDPYYEGQNEMIIDNNPSKLSIFYQSGSGKLYHTNYYGETISDSIINSSREIQPKRFYLSSVEPAVWSPDSYVNIKGSFGSELDSIRLNNTTIVDFGNSFPGYIYDKYNNFRYLVEEGLQSGVLKFYYGDSVYYTSDTITYFNKPVPVIESASTYTVNSGSIVYLTGSHLSLIDSILVGEQNALFTTEHYNKYKILIPSGLKDGKVSYYGNGEQFQWDKEFKIVNNSLLDVSITGVDYDSSFIVYGKNFDKIDNVIIEGIEVSNYQILGNDKLIFDLPNVLYKNINRPVLSLIFGDKSVQAELMRFNGRDWYNLNIDSISTTRASYSSNFDIYVSAEDKNKDIFKNIYIGNRSYDFTVNEVDSLGILQVTVQIPDFDETIKSGFISIEDFKGTTETDIYLDIIDQYCEQQGLLYNPELQVGISKVRLGNFEKLNEASCKLYRDLKSQPINVSAGHKLPLEVWKSNCSAPIEDFWTFVVIDWNGDGQFSENEIVLKSNLPKMSYFNLTVPETVNAGDSILMRVLVSKSHELANSWIDDTEACGEIGQIVVNDYTLVIKQLNEPSVDDFYPKNVSDSAIIYVNGNGFESLNSISLNNLNIPIEQQSDHFLKLRIPENSSTGKLIFEFSEGIVETKDSLIVDGPYGAIEPIKDYQYYGPAYLLEGIYYELMDTLINDVFDITVAGKAVAFDRTIPLARRYWSFQKGQMAGELQIYTKGKNNGIIGLQSSGLRIIENQDMYGYWGDTVYLDIESYTPVKSLSLDSNAVDFKQLSEFELYFIVPDKSDTSRIIIENQDSKYITSFKFIARKPEPLVNTENLLKDDLLSSIQINGQKFTEFDTSGITDFSSIPVDIYAGWDNVIIIDSKDSIYTQVISHYLNTFGYSNFFKEKVNKNSYDIGREFEGIIRVARKSSPAIYHELKFKFKLSIPEYEPIVVDSLNLDFDYYLDCNNHVVAFEHNQNDIEGISWEWDFGDGNSSVKSAPVHEYASSGNFSVRLNAIYGSDTFSITKNIYLGDQIAKPVIIATNNEVLVCENEEVNLKLDKNYNFYQWNTGSNESEIIADRNAKYTVRVSMDGVCWSEYADFVTVNKAPLPEKPILDKTGDLQVCDNEYVKINIENSYSDVYYPDFHFYTEWVYPGDVGYTKIRSMPVNWDGEYKVRVSFNEGCWSEYSDPVVAEKLKTPLIPELDKEGTKRLCENEELQLSLDSNYVIESGQIFEWNNGETSNAIIVSDTGEYKVRSSFSNGCWTNYSQPFTINYLLSAPIPVLIKNGDSLLIDLNSITDNVYYSPKFNWYKNNNLIENESNPVLEISEGGYYSGEIQYLNGCFGRSDEIFVDYNLNNSIIYPNPASEDFITFKEVEENSLVAILDESGKIVMQTNLKNFTLDITSLNPGVYSVRCEVNGEIVILRFIRL